MTAPRLMRDAYIDAIYAAARDDAKLMFLSADFGAAALDAFRRDFPDRFLHMGIAEQNMVDVGAGLALSGKNVFLYAMAPFITARCYEQTKCVIASMQLPVTLIAVGVGLGYDHATLTHFTPEDLAIMRNLNGIEIWTPADDIAAETLARRTIGRPAFRYIRLERMAQPRLYSAETFAAACDDGYALLRAGRDLALVGCGTMTHTLLAAADRLAQQGVDAAVVDVFRIKPLPTGLAALLGRYPRVLTLEEQMLEGGFGSAILEILADAGVARPLRRLGLKDGFRVENGDREHLHRLYGIDADAVVAAALAQCRERAA